MIKTAIAVGMKPKNNPVTLTRIDLISNISPAESGTALIINNIPINPMTIPKIESYSFFFFHDFEKKILYKILMDNNKDALNTNPLIISPFILPRIMESSRKMGWFHYFTPFIILIMSMGVATHLI